MSGLAPTGCDGGAEPPQRRPRSAGRSPAGGGGGRCARRAGQGASRPSTEALRAPAGSRLYEQLATRLLDFVEVTGLTVGDRLPSERDLAEALHVSRASVRQATIALEVRGTLEVRHGDGIYLRSLPNDSGHLMELMTQRHRLPAILEAREALETQLAALAAARRTDEDVAEMTRALAVMTADIEADGFGEEGDRLFHQAVPPAAPTPPPPDSIPRPAA